MEYLKFYDNQVSLYCKSNTPLLYCKSNTPLKTFKGNENLKKGFEVPPSEGKRKQLRKKRKK